MEKSDEVLMHVNKIMTFDDESIVYRKGFLEFLRFVRYVEEKITMSLDYQELKEMFYIAEASDSSEKYKEGVEDAINYLSNKSSQDFYITEYITEGAISFFTLRDRETAIKYCGKHKEDLENVELEENGASITMKDGHTIKFMLLSNFLGNFDKIDDQTKNELESKKRRGKCHSGSINIAQTFLFPCSIVTGYIYGVSNKDKILHSWIEFELENTEMAIDYTLNAIMDKSAYMHLHKAEEITRISSETLKKDIQAGILEKLGIFKVEKSKDEPRVIIATQKYYLLFRNQILTDLMNSKANDINIKKEDIELEDWTDRFSTKFYNYNTIKEIMPNIMLNIKVN